MHGGEGGPPCEHNGDVHQFATHVFFQVEMVGKVKIYSKKNFHQDQCLMEVL
jgi:hypothetical protein